MYLKKRLLALAAALCFAVSVPLLALATESDFSPETDDPVSDPPLSSEFSSEPEPPSSSEFEPEPSSDPNSSEPEPSYTEEPSVSETETPPPYSEEEPSESTSSEEYTYGAEEGGNTGTTPIPTPTARASYKPVATPVSYTHLTLPTN